MLKLASFVELSVHVRMFCPAHAGVARRSTNHSQTVIRQIMPVLRPVIARRRLRAIDAPLPRADRPGPCPPGRSRAGRLGAAGTPQPAAPPSASWPPRAAAPHPPAPFDTGPVGRGASFVPPTQSTENWRAHLAALVADALRPRRPRAVSSGAFLRPPRARRHPPPRRVPLRAAAPSGRARSAGSGAPAPPAVRRASPSLNPPANTRARAPRTVWSIETPAGP